MADLFLQNSARSLLANKKIIFIGDSNIRALYKDVVQLIEYNSLIDENDLKAKLENSFCGDSLIYRTHQHKGRDFKEERRYQLHSMDFSFYFITHCYDDYVEGILCKMAEKPKPDVVIMNSCLWDITRWGPAGVDNYKRNLQKLMKKLNEILQPSCLFIWTTTLPISQEIRGGFLIKQIEFMRHQLRFEVMEANLYAWNTVTENGYDVLDFHYHMHMQIQRRTNDGVHWKNDAVRYMTNLVLTHISLAWNISLPGHVKTGTLLNGMLEKPLKPDISPIKHSSASCLSNSAPQKQAGASTHLTRRLSLKRRKRKTRRSLKRSCTYPQYRRFQEETYYADDFNRDQFSFQSNGFFKRPDIPQRKILHAARRKK